jgi:hypothetical protein
MTTEKKLIKDYDPKKIELYTKKHIYSDIFTEKLKSTLGNSLDFENSSKSTRISISNKIKNIFQLQDYTKSIQKMKYSSKIIDKILFLEKKNFIEQFKTLLLEIIPRKDSGLLKNQLIKSIKLVSKHLLKIMGDDKFDVTDEQAIDIAENYNIEELFNLVISVAFSRIQKKVEIDDVIDYHEDKLMDFDITLESVSFFPALRESMINHIVKSILIYKKIKGDDHFVALKLLGNRKRTIDLSQEGSILTFVKQIESLFEQTVAERTTLVSISNKNQRRKIYTLPDKLDEYIPIVAHLPEIIEPKQWNHDQFIENVEYIKKIKNGLSDVNCSDKSIQSLRDSQKKKMTINPNMAKVLRYLDTLEYDQAIMLNVSPFVPLAVVLREDERFLDENVDVFSYKDMLQIRQIKKRSNKNWTEFIKELYNEMDLTEEIYVRKIKNYHELCEFQKMKTSREISNSLVLMAQIFEGFPIYFLNSVDYRLRIYPWSFLFSRTTGIYKYFLQDYKSEKLDLNGMKNFLRAYYNKDPLLKNSFERSNFNHIDEVAIYFKSNKINLVDSKKYIYFALVEREIEKAINNGFKTRFMIEIDQKSSSSVFLSLLLGNKELALESNLLGGKPRDVPTFLSSKTGEFFNLKIWGTNDHKLVIKDFESNRNLHKYAFMCFCYNQTNYGRIEEWLKIYGKDITSAQKEIIYEFSSSYEEFLDFCFKGLIDQRNKLNLINMEVLEQFKNVIIKTLDGSILQWQIFKTDNKVRKFKDPMNQKKNISYRNSILHVNSFNFRKMQTSFLPGLIHSIDASVMREIILRMIQKGYYINHVHDSIMLHPNYVESLYEVIDNIYTDPEYFKDLLKKTFVDIAASVVNHDAARSIKAMYNEFNQKCDKFVITKGVFNSKNLYCFE